MERASEVILQLFTAAFCAGYLDKLLGLSHVWENVSVEHAIMDSFLRLLILSAKYSPKY
jgi:hypothetical protein